MSAPDLIDSTFRGTRISKYNLCTIITTAITTLLNNFIYNLFNLFTSLYLSSSLFPHPLPSLSLVIDIIEIYYRIIFYSLSPSPSLHCHYLWLFFNFFSFWRIINFRLLFLFRLFLLLSLLLEIRTCFLLEKVQEFLIGQLNWDFFPEKVFEKILIKFDLCF